MKIEDKNEKCLELDHLALPLLVTAELEVLSALDGDLDSVFASATFKTEDQLLGGLGLLTQDGL